MIDPKLLRQDPDAVAREAKRHNVDIDIAFYKSLEAERKSLQEKTQELQAKRNQFAKQVGMAKSKGEDVSKILAENKTVDDTLKQSEIALVELQKKLLDFQLQIPNVLHASVPNGKSENDNVEIRKWGTPKKFDFKPKDHVDLGAQNNLMDFDTAAKIAGSRFVVLRGQLAKLQRALAEFMLDLHINEHGYTEMYVPYLVHSDALIGTGEVSLANTVRDEIIDEKKLPLKMVAHSPCFRSEAGSYGKDTRGMIRQHQFQKVELVQVVKPEDSYAALEEITRQAEKVLQLLELPYRVLVLCSADVGFTSAKTYDLEVWLPSQNCYREISSC